MIILETIMAKLGKRRGKTPTTQRRRGKAAPVPAPVDTTPAAGPVTSGLFYTVVNRCLWAVLFTAALKHFGVFERFGIQLPYGLDNDDLYTVSFSLQTTTVALVSLVVLSLASLAMATEHKLTGGEYLDRAPVGLKEFQSFGLGALSDSASGADLYLDVLKRSLCNMIYYESSHPIHIYGPDKKIKLANGFHLYSRVHGEDLPANAMSMIGMKRMNNIQGCIENVLKNKIPGDLIETGACKGGATIFMRGCLKAMGNKTRKVFVCDTFSMPEPSGSWIVHVIIGWITNLLVSIPSKAFRGKLINALWKAQKDFPQSDGELGEDEQAFAAFLLRNLIHLRPVPSVQKAYEHVKSNFARYGLLDDRVVFLKGWFSETIPSAPIKNIAVLRMDGDTYESTIDALNMCYPKLSSGGYCIVDDYWSLEDCKRAVDEYRATHGITEPIVRIDGLSCYWQRA